MEKATRLCCVNGHRLWAYKISNAPDGWILICWEERFYYPTSPDGIRLPFIGYKLDSAPEIIAALAKIGVDAKNQVIIQDRAPDGTLLGTRSVLTIKTG